MILAGLIGTLSASGGATKSISLGSIAYNTISEGVEQTVNLDYVSWDNSTVYWTIKNNLGAELTGQVTPVSGDFNPGSGSGTYSINFTFDVDTTTDGSLTYYLYVGSIPGSGDYITSSGYTVRDSSQAQALFLDVDPASIVTAYGLVGWTDASGKGNNIFVSNGTKSTDNGGVLIFDGTTTYAGDVMDSNLSHAIFGSVTVSAWIKPSVVNVTQTIISKEICYKMIITSDGRIAWMVGDVSGNNWTTTIYAAAGLVTAGAWAHVAAVVDTNATKIYVNGILAGTGGGATLITNSYKFAIGAYNSSSNNYGDYFGGRMGQVKLWNYALTDTDVIGQYNTTATRYGLSVIPLSLDFPGTGNPYVLVSNTQTDWNLGTTYTIEYWSKETNASTSNIRTVMSQGPDSGKIDLGYMYGHLLFNNTEPTFAEPTPAVWTHVAFVRESGSGNITLYYNGLLQTTFSAGTALSDGSSDLYIGKRGAAVNGQGFYGKLAMLRISTTAKYLTAFDPSLTYGVEADTKLMLRYDPLVDTSIYELNGIVTSQGNGSTIYFSKTTYPNLNNQVKAGDTVVDAGTLDTSTVTAAVYTADPDNWGINISPPQPGGTKNFSSTGRHPISVQGAVGISTDFPSYLSLEFNQPQGDYLSTPASADWNLGTTWTMEFWINANNASGAGIHIPGGQWGLFNQSGWYGGIANNSIIIGLASGKLTIGQGTNGDAIEFAEPTAQQWTHVAVVNNGGGSAQKVYYNGVEQTLVAGSYLNNGWTNTTDALYIGRLSPPTYQSHFDGKMAMIRISNAAKYVANFTATTTYGVEPDTKLFLSKFNPTVDAKSHTITNNGVTTSTSFPS